LLRMDTPRADKPGGSSPRTRPAAEKGEARESSGEFGPRRRDQPGVHAPLSGCRCVDGRVFRGCRFARPPANFWSPFRAGAWWVSGKETVSGLNGTAAWGARIYGHGRRAGDSADRLRKRCQDSLLDHPRDRTDSAGAHPVCVAPAWSAVSCFLDVSYGCACGGAGRRQAGCRQGLAPVGESPSSAGSRAVVGDHRPPSIPPIPRSHTPLTVDRSVWGGALGVSLRSTPGSFLQPLWDRCLWVSWEAQEEGFSRMNTQRADNTGGLSAQGASFALPPGPLAQSAECSSPGVISRERGHARGGAAGQPPIGFTDPRKEGGV